MALWAYPSPFWISTIQISLRLLAARIILGNMALMKLESEELEKNGLKNTVRRVVKDIIPQI